MADRVVSTQSCPQPSYPTQSYIPFADEADTNSDSSYGEEDSDEVRARREDLASMLRSIDERKKRMSDLRDKFYSDYELGHHGLEDAAASDQPAPAEPTVEEVQSSLNVYIPDEVRQVAQGPASAVTDGGADSDSSASSDYLDSDSEDSESTSGDSESAARRNYQSGEEAMDTDDVLSNNLSAADEVDCVMRPDTAVQETDIDNLDDDLDEALPVTNLDDFPRTPEVPDTDLDDVPRSPAAAAESPETDLDDVPRSPAAAAESPETDLDDVPRSPAAAAESLETDLDDVPRWPTAVAGAQETDLDDLLDQLETPADQPPPAAVEAQSESDSESGSDDSDSSSDSSATSSSSAAEEDEQPKLDTLPVVTEEPQPDSQRSSMLSTDSEEDDSDEERATDLYSRDLDEDVETLQISSIEDLMKYSLDHVTHGQRKPPPQLKKQQQSLPPPQKQPGVKLRQPNSLSLPTIAERNSECSDSDVSLSRSSSINSSFGKADSRLKRRGSKKDAPTVEGSRRGLDRASEPIDEDKVLEPAAAYQQPAVSLPSEQDRVTSTEDYRPKTSAAPRYSFTSPRPFKPAAEEAKPPAAARPRPPPPPVPSAAPVKIPPPPPPTAAKPPPPPLPPKKPKPVSVVAPLSNGQEAPQQQTPPPPPTAPPPATAEQHPRPQPGAGKKKSDSVEAKKSPGVRALIASMESKARSQEPPAPPPKPAKKPSFRKPPPSKPQPQAQPSAAAAVAQSGDMPKSAPEIQKIAEGEPPEAPKEPAASQPVEVASPASAAAPVTSEKPRPPPPPPLPKSTVKAGPPSGLLASSPKPFSLSSGNSSAAPPKPSAAAEKEKKEAPEPAAEPDAGLQQVLGAAKKQRAEDVVQELIAMDTTIDVVSEDLGSIDKTLEKMSSTNQLKLSNPDLRQDAELQVDVSVGDVQVQTDDLPDPVQSAAPKRPQPPPPPPAAAETRIDTDDSDDNVGDSSSSDEESPSLTDSSSDSTSDSGDDYEEPPAKPVAKATEAPQPAPVEDRQLKAKTAPAPPAAQAPIRPSLAAELARISQENLAASQPEQPPPQQRTPSRMSLKDKIKSFEASNALGGAADDGAEPLQKSAATAALPEPSPAVRHPAEQPEPLPAAYANVPPLPQRQRPRPPPPLPPIPKPRGSLENLADNTTVGEPTLHYANLELQQPPPPAPPRAAPAREDAPSHYQNVQQPQQQQQNGEVGDTLHYASSQVALNLAGLDDEEANRAMRVYEHHEETVNRELQRRSQEVSQAAIDAEFARYNQAVKRRSRESPTLSQRSPFATLTPSGRLSGPRPPSLDYQQQLQELKAADEPAESDEQQQQPRYRKHGGTLDGRQDPAADAFARAKRISKSLGPKERRQKKTKSAELADQSYRGVDLETPPRPPQRQKHRQSPQKQQPQPAGKRFASSNDLISSSSGSGSSSDAGSETEDALPFQQKPVPPLPPHGRHSQHDMQQQVAGEAEQAVQYANLASHQRARSLELLEEPRLPTADTGRTASGRFTRGGGGPSSVASSMLSVNVANKDSEELAQLLERYLQSKRDEKIQRMLMALRAQDPAKHRLLMERYKDELASSTGYAALPAVASLAPPARGGGHPLAASTATLLNNLEPGVTNVMLGPEGTLREAASLHTMLHPAEPVRTVHWDPAHPETPPPAMRPPPKPMPPGLSKTVPPDGWKSVDDHVMELLDVDCNTFAEQANSLCGRFQSDVEKCRAIFRFLTARLVQPLVYDPQAPLTTLIGCLRGVQAGEVSPHELFKRLCAHAGIHCEILHGYSKGAGYRPGMNLKDNRMFRNTWTAVYVEGCWRFVNVAWGGRRLAKRSGGSELRLKCDDFYFLTEPEEHIYEHWPDDRRWQLLRSSITLSHFMRLPMLKSPFFNAGLRLKKGKYDDTLMTQNGRVSLKIGVTKFVGVSCQLQNRSDMSSLRGKTLARLIGEVLHVLASPAQPGTYFLNIFVSSDWTANEHELAASFQIKCAENNFDRLALGRYPDVGFLGATPAAQRLGISFLTAHGAKTPMDPYVVHSAKELLRLPLVAAPGLRVAHQMKCFQRSGAATEQCDAYALLQCRGKQQAEYWVACPADGYYFFTVYAGEPDSEADKELDCVYRMLIDCRRGLGKVPAFPAQTSLFNGCYLHEPLQQHLDVGRKYNFRLETRHFRSVAVVLNGKTWLDLDASRGGVWSKKLNVGEELGELSVYGQLETDEQGQFNKLLDYDIVQRISNLAKA